MTESIKSSEIIKTQKKNFESFEYNKLTSPFDKQFELTSVYKKN